jgi:hypothetical protein
MKSLPKSVFFLVDGIYPSYSRFVRGIKQPATWKEEKYSSWQEGARKDVEKDFNTWQFLVRPNLLHDMKAPPTELFLVCSFTISLSQTELCNKTLLLTTTGSDMILQRLQIFKLYRLLLQERQVL